MPTDAAYRHRLSVRFRDTTVWARLALPAQATIEGPAILEQPDATTVIEPGHLGRVDALGNVIVERA